MLLLHRVGLIAREHAQRYPIERLKSLFERYRVELVEIQEGASGGVQEGAGGLDLILAVGGDGTVLRALGLFPNIPVLGINFGTIGFLTAGEQSEIEPLVERLFSGDYFVEERWVLETRFQNQTYLAINEMVAKATMKMVAVDVFIDGNFVHTFRGDGVIVGTPTGSTSYLMATGSSIVMPTVDCFILNGINEHRFSNRSIVVKGSSVVRLRINPMTRETDIFLAHDGRDKIPLGLNDEIEVRRHNEPIRLVFYERDYFFKNLKSRLRW